MLCQFIVQRSLLIVTGEGFQEQGSGAPISHLVGHEAKQNEKKMNLTRENVWMAVLNSQSPMDLT